MNKILKKSISFMATLIMIFSMYSVAFAQGTTSISITNSSIGVGDTTVVSVSASASGTVTIKYTASLMNLIDCTASGYKYEGNTVTFTGTEGDLKFKATAEGTASIIVSSSSCTGSSTTISIGSSGASNNQTSSQSDEASSDEPKEEAAGEDSSEETAEAPVQAADASPEVGTLNADGGFDINGVAYVVSERYSDSEIPSGFSKTTISIGDSTYNELTNGTITIIYLKPADKTSGSGEFYIYNEANGTVTKLVMIGDTKNYVMIATVSSVLSEALIETTLTTEEGSCVAYQLEGSQFYYIYGLNQDGVAGWFMYDSEYGSITRADEMAVSRIAISVPSTEEDIDPTPAYNPLEVYQKKLEKFRLIVSGLVILCVILVFVIINLSTKKARRSSSDDDGDEEDDFDDGDIFAKRPARPSKRMPRSIVFEDPTKDYDEDEEDDIDVDIELEDTSREKEPAKTSSSGLDMMDLNDL